MKDAKEEVIEDITDAFDRKEMCDLIVKCGDEEFECHKFMLAARSKFFRAMLQAEMKESISGVINIQDIEPEVFKDLLDFIYTGSAPNIEENAQDLLIAADKYDLELLKTCCEKEFTSTLAMDNLMEYLKLADWTHATALKKTILSFISKNKLKMKSIDWKQELKEYPHLLAEVVDFLLDH